MENNIPKDALDCVITEDDYIAAAFLYGGGPFSYTRDEVRRLKLSNLLDIKKSGQHINKSALDES